MGFSIQTGCLDRSIRTSHVRRSFQTCFQISYLHGGITNACTACMPHSWSHAVSRASSARPGSTNTDVRMQSAAAVTAGLFPFGILREKLLFPLLGIRLGARAEPGRARVFAGRALLIWVLWRHRRLPFASSFLHVRTCDADAIPLHGSVPGGSRQRAVSIQYFSRGELMVCWLRYFFVKLRAGYRESVLRTL